MPKWTEIRARHSALVRHRGTDDPETRAVRTELADLQTLRELAEAAPLMSPAGRRAAAQQLLDGLGGDEAA
jgi:hypothetical protein